MRVDPLSLDAEHIRELCGIDVARAADRNMLAHDLRHPHSDRFDVRHRELAGCRRFRVHR
jgi:hypothetical protein